MKIKNINYTHKLEYHNDSAAREVLPFIFNLLEIESVFDIGCGMGTWLSVAKSLGKKITGVDGIRVNRELSYINDKEIIEHDLRKPFKIDQKFDLAICLEVAEHLPLESAETLVDTITNHSDLVLFSAAIPYQTGDHHLNEQHPSYWQKLFSKKGFFALDILRLHFWNNPNVDWWYRQNMLIYTNREDIKHLGVPINEVLNLIHPDLLEMKESELLRINNTVQKLIQPNFISAFKTLARSILRGNG